ncbi:MAG TPA: NAD(P)/FAD-dependent oxidoreductase [Candidatus Dormibacteraeota bacterium]|nr:NAD(P)/FAD-dependent oxidoreductase [Candidatus Dormibacteraeota bacterium]
MNGWEIVVAGAGHNSLLTAAYAAKAGFKVLVLEGAARIGGDTTCEELTLPGFIHDPCSTAHNLIQSNPLMRNDELRLDRYGLRYLYPDPVFTMPFRDGRSITMWRDLDRTCAELTRFSSTDAKAYRELLNDWQAMAPIVNDERENPPRPPREVAARTAASQLGQRMLNIRRATALDIILERFSEEHVRAFFAWIAFMTLQPLDEPETGLLAFSLVAGRQRFSWILPEGGSIRLPLALAGIIEENGGTILTSKPVTRIVIEGGRATGVETADGSTYAASKAVVSTIHIAELPGIVGEANLTPQFRAGIDRWKPSLSMFAAHYALSEAPRFRTEAGPMESVTMGGLDSLGSLHRMLNAYRSGRLDLDDPVFLAITPTVIDASRAPAGKHTFKLISFLPYELAEGPQHWDQVKEQVADRLFEALAPLTTNLSERIVLGRNVASPLDMERRNPANWRGSCHGGASTPDQSGYFRPVEGWSTYRTPVEGLYQTGACTHPGGSVSGLPGRNCAAILLQDLGSSLSQAVQVKEKVT